MKALFDLIKKLTENDKKTLSQKTLKATEELGELAKAVLPFEDAHATTHRFAEKRQIFENVIDTTLCVWSVAIDLGYTLDEIEEMMKIKALYWSELQAREDEADWPVPFEIHITVSDAELDTFKAACALAEVKPIVLDLQDREGTSVLKDVMTSSVHMGRNSTAYTEMQRISAVLSDSGLNVTREKIETVPWHPAAPSYKHTNPVMPKDCYFESHLAIRTDEARLGKVREIADRMDCHLSRNVFKRLDDGDFIIMSTYREYDGIRESFTEQVSTIVEEFRAYNFDVDKVIVEFSVYDTKVSHDANWITSSDQ